MKDHVPDHTRRAVWFLWVLCALLYANWIVMVARFQPNVMVMDQWDFFYALFYGGGAWGRFIHQHGPVREGLGFVISGWILEATNLDVRYDSIWIATLLLAATLLALRLKTKMCGSLGLLDAWIPVLFLSLGQFETVVSTPNASHSVMPLALMLLAANVWLSLRPAIRYGMAAAIAFTLTFTGFGLFAGAVIAALLAAAIVRHACRREYRMTWLPAGGLAVIVASWVLFSKGCSTSRPGIPAPARRITGWAACSRSCWRQPRRVSHGCG